MMIPRYYYDIDQNTTEWDALRRGRLTASDASVFITPAKLEPSTSKTCRSLIRGKAMEYLGGVSQSQPRIWQFEFGHQHQPAAIEAYSALTGNEVTPVGFVSLEDVWGCSPDGLIGNDGDLEVKCHQSLAAQADAILDGPPKEHYLQMQYRLWIMGRLWCDYVPYVPEHLCPPVELALHVRRVPRASDAVIKKIEAAAIEARKWLVSTIQELREKTKCPLSMITSAVNS